MEVIWFLLPLALLVAGIFLGLFFWATRDGQFDDLEGESLKILLDDESVKINKNEFVKKGGR